MRRRILRGVLPALLLVSLSACMTPGAVQLRQQTPVAVELAQVPYFAQQDYHCGPATLAMVMGSLGHDVSPEALAPHLYLPGRQGSLAEEMQALSRRHGFLPVPVGGRLPGLVQALQEGSPVIVRQNNGLSFAPLWHYAVVIGVDSARQRVILRSGAERRLELTVSQFERTWARGDYWAMRLLPTSQDWPASLRASDVTPALLAMRHVAPDAALAGLRRAAWRWPTEVALWLAWADLSGQREGLAAAELVLRDAVAVMPEQPWLLNNLADVLLRQGRPAEALPWARQARRLSDAAVVQETLAAVEKALVTPAR